MVIDPRIKKELETYLHDRIGKNRQQAIMLSAYKMSGEEMKMLQKAISPLAGYQITNLVDKSIIGGVVIRFGTKIIDLSIKGQLNNFKKLMYEID